MIPEVSIRLESVPIVGNPRKLSAIWTEVDFSQNFEDYLDAIEEARSRNRPVASQQVYPDEEI